jgi:hypothetical protein
MTNLPTDHLSGVFSTYSEHTHTEASPQVTSTPVTSDAGVIDASPPSKNPFNYGAQTLLDEGPTQGADVTTAHDHEELQTTQKAVEIEQTVARGQLLTVLETVLAQLKQDPAFDMVPRQITDTQLTNLKLEPVSVNDRTEEIDQLKSLLIEAQETIIKLLSDRVEDRAKIANLEAEAKYLPVTKKNNTEQHLGLAIEYEALKKELFRVSTELSQLEKMHASLRLKQKTTSFWAKFWGVGQ